MDVITPAAPPRLEIAGTAEQDLMLRQDASPVLPLSISAHGENSDG